MNNGSRKVLKIIHHPLGKPEYNFQSRASANNISPKVYKLKLDVKLEKMASNYFFKTRPNHDKINAFLMNNLKKNTGNTVKSVYAFMKTAPRVQRYKVLDKLAAKVAKLSSMGIEHANLHTNNAYVIIKANGSLDVMIIDYGRSKYHVGAHTRAYTRGNIGTRFGRNVSNQYPNFGPIWGVKPTKKNPNPNPVILNRNKLAIMKSNYL